MRLSLLSIPAFAAIAACAGSSVNGAPPAGSLIPLPPAYRTAKNHAPRNLLYVADYLNASVLIYRQSGKNRAPIGQITAGLTYPNSLAVDALDNLYVVNDPNNVVVYAAGKRSPFEALAPDVYALSVAVGNDETVYVGDGCSACTKKIDVFTGGSLNPSYVITDSRVAQVIAMALDASNNLYAAYLDTDLQSRMMVFAPGSRGPGTDLGLSFQFATGLAFDAKGNMIVVDEGAAEVFVYPPKSQTVKYHFSTPYRPWGVALNADQTRVFVNENRSTPVVDVYSYPGGKHVETIPLTPGGDASAVATFSAPAP